jgi:ribonuclease E/ribonuclease G
MNRTPLKRTPLNRTTVIVESDASGLRAALVRDRRLEAIEIDSERRPSLVGAVAEGRVARTLPGLGAIIRLADGAELLLARGREPPSESGQTVLVQVSRDADGDKLAAATANVSLGGRALVHLPLGSGIRVSKRLDLEPGRRGELEAMLNALPGGWILRAAARMSTSDIAVEAVALAAEGAALPSPRKPPDAFRRLMTDHGSTPPRQILVSGRAARNAVEGWCEAFAPDLSPRIEYHDPGAALFDSHDLDGVIAGLFEPRVALPNGASLIIEPTAALTAIDVNAGPELNTLTVNLEAAAEIGRQLRLRHIGGLIVIDFISMSRPRDGDKVREVLAAALADDAAQTHILPMSKFGLIEMTRDRRGPRLPPPV